MGRLPCVRAGLFSFTNTYREILEQGQDVLSVRESFRYLLSFVYYRGQRWWSYIFAPTVTG
jgi:hypothetical protein